MYENCDFVPSPLKNRFQYLADFFNQADITPDGEAGDNPFPSVLYDYEGKWGIAFKFNNGDSKWFVVEGPHGNDDDNTFFGI